jgi:hypothetical protein
MASSWQRLATYTLTSTGDTLSTASDTSLTGGVFTAKKYLKFEYMIIRDTADCNDNIHFNDETDDGNYSMRRNFNGGDESAFNGTNPSGGNGFYYGTVDSSPLIYATGTIVNITNKEKLGILQGNASGTAGAGNAPSLRRENVFKWSNTSVPITKITLTNNISGNYGIGSTLIVWGADDDVLSYAYPNIYNGTLFEESDTGKIYMFDGTDTWNELT